MSIIIGREENTDAPRLSLQVNGEQLWLGQPGSVPKSVSRKHCSMDINSNGTFTITNISESNLLEINGKLMLKSSGVTPDSVVRLGRAGYVLDLKAIMNLLSTKKLYSIAHLKEVYDNYVSENEQLQIRQSQIQALATLPGVLSPISLIVAFTSQNQSLRIVMYVFTAIFAAATFIWRMYNAKALPNKKKIIADKFSKEYVCPNKLCGKELVNYKYTNLVNAACCPYCKAKFKEK